jgi:hypothetical protein
MPCFISLYHFDAYFTIGCQEFISNQKREGIFGYFFELTQKGKSGKINWYGA